MEILLEIFENTMDFYSYYNWKWLYETVLLKLGQIWSDLLVSD